jgi:hypothetical protein
MVFIFDFCRRNTALFLGDEYLGEIRELCNVLIRFKESVQKERK